MTDFSSESDNLHKISGTVYKVVYKNDSTGYTVIDVEESMEDGEPVDGSLLVTCVGVMPMISAGEEVTLTGRFEVNKKFGDQFKVEICERELPTGESAMLRYLQSGTIKGIGPVTAKLIIDKFGERAFDVIENNPAWLSDIRGITRKKAEQIGEEFKRQFGERSVMLFCSEYCSAAQSVKIYKKYGQSAVDRILQNPYILCGQELGISFETCDRIAEAHDIPHDSPFRVKGAVIFELNKTAATEGNDCLPVNELIKRVMSAIEVEKENVVHAINDLAGEGQIKNTILDDKKLCFLKEYYEAEKFIAEKLDLLSSGVDSMGIDMVEAEIRSLEAQSGIQYDLKQKNAILSAVNSGVMILTGGPGTGKTTITRAIIKIFKDMRYKVALAAPTGRAAKRLSEATGYQTKTVHRLLEMNYRENGKPNYERNESNPLEEKVIIIDEASMLDTLLTQALLKAIRPGSRVIFVGDANQLPSVGAGNVLRDLISSEYFKTEKLKDIYRQARESLIVTNAHLINNGEYPELESRDNDFFFLRSADAVSAADKIVDFCVNRIPRSYGADSGRMVQVISPSKNGDAGTIALNEKLRAAINPPSPDKKEKRVGKHLFREGDKVMQIRNNYEAQWKQGSQEGTGIFNGDIGIIKSIKPLEQTVTVRYDDKEVIYPFTDLDQLEHAYAITVHKSQGSEYPIIIMPAFLYARALLTRNLLYTAVTRAQKYVLIIGDEQVIKYMVDNNEEKKRFTGLVSFIKEMEKNNSGRNR